MTKDYRYIRNNPSGEKLYKFRRELVMDGEVQIEVQVVDYYLTPEKAYEAMAHACSTWGKALGAQNIAQGAIDPSTSVDLSNSAYILPGEDDPGFGDEHSGQFNGRIQNLKPFYDELLRQFDIERYP